MNSIKESASSIKEVMLCNKTYLYQCYVYFHRLDCHSPKGRKPTTIISVALSLNIIDNTLLTFDLVSKEYITSQIKFHISDAST